MVDTLPPRGIRNKNPGNIRKSADKWQGLAPAQNDPAFFQFIGESFGIRALAKILLTYQSKHGLNTVRKIIGRWAPPNENDTEAYMQQVAKAARVSPDQIINLADPQILVAIVTAIIRHENGVQPYSAVLIRQGVDMART